MATYDRTRIQAALRAFVLAGPFYSVTYNETTKAPTVGTTLVTPASIVVNEVQATFGEARNNRRGYTLDRQGWLFQMLVAFEGEALLEAFEKAWCEDPPKLARDPANGLNHNVILVLGQADYEHPLQHEPTSGTAVTYTVQAVMSPN